MKNNIKTLGLITAPGFPREIGAKLEEELPELLHHYIDEDYEWGVVFEVDSLTGMTEQSSNVLEEAIFKKNTEKWDYTIAITDLPLFKGNKAIIAEACEREDVALISLPGLGSVPIVRRVRESILQLLDEMYHGTSDTSRLEARQRIQQKKEEKNEKLLNNSSRHLLGKKAHKKFFPITRETAEDSSQTVDVRYIVDSPVTSFFRVLTGMVRSNKPWVMFKAFKKLIIVAFSAGAYALIFPTIWMLSNSYSIWRMCLLTVFSILAMTIWLIIAHNLWEKKGISKNAFMRKLYNASTFITVLLTVGVYYLILFVLFSITVTVLLPIGLLQSELSDSVGYINYFYIIWIITSLSTIIGALGNVLEEEEVVLSSTYGYRQRQRYEYIKREREKKKNKKNRNKRKTKST